MAIRVRADGRILCAAMHPALPDDRAYIDDGLHYKLSVELGALVTEPMESDPDRPGLGGHGHHGQWWWRDEVPDSAVLEERPREFTDAAASTATDPPDSEPRPVAH